jgi:phosphoglycolate phosphatase
LTPAFRGADVRLLAVDLDGTLVDSAPDLNHCLGEALGAVGLSRPTEAETRAWIGDGVEELLRRALAKATPGADPDSFRSSGSERHATFERAFEEFSASYARNLYVRSRLYSAVAETLDALLHADVRLVCVTNKRLRFAKGVLELAGIADRFELVLGGDSLPEKKPSPAQLNAAADRLGVSALHAALVGDSPQDLAAAQAADWSFIWARYGYCAELELTAGPRLAAIAEFSSLPALLGKRA